MASIVSLHAQPRSSIDRSNSLELVFSKAFDLEQALLTHLPAGDYKTSACSLLEECLTSIVRSVQSNGRIGVRVNFSQL